MHYFGNKSWGRPPIDRKYVYIRYDQQNASLRPYKPTNFTHTMAENGRSVWACSGTSVTGRTPQTESDNSVTLVLCIRRHSALLSVPLYETAALGQGGNQEAFSTSDREYDWECLITMRSREKIFALVLSDHHIKFPYMDGNDVSFVLWWKEHGPNGIAAKEAAKGRSLTMQSSEPPAAIHSTTPFQVTGSPDRNLVLRIDAEAILPSNWIQPKPIRS